MTQYRVKQREEQFLSVENENDVKRLIFRVSAGESNLSNINLLRIAREIIDKEEEHFHSATIFFWYKTDDLGKVVARASITFEPGSEWDSPERINQEDFDGFAYRVDFNRYNQS